PRCPASKVGLARSAALRSAFRLASTAGQRGGPYAPRCPASKVGLARLAALRSAYRLSSTAGAARGPLRPTLPRLESWFGAFGGAALRLPLIKYGRGSAGAPTPHAAPPRRLVWRVRLRFLLARAAALRSAFRLSSTAGQRGGPYAPRCPASKMGAFGCAALRLPLIQYGRA